MNSDIEKLFTLLVSTLNLILLPTKDKGELYLTDVENKLNELEGDYYTFLHKVNLDKLVNNNLISLELADMLDGIWKQVNAIEPTFWNSPSFINDPKWQDIREKVTNLLPQLA